MSTLLEWQIYEITAKQSSLNGVMLRGRIRKFGIEHEFDILAENTEDAENGVRFAVLDQTYGQAVSDYVKSIIPDSEIRLVSTDVVNPVLSKLKVNQADRYSL